MNDFLDEPAGTADDDEPVEDFLTVAEWDALPLSVRVSHQLAAIMMLVSTVRDDIHTEEGSRLLWMEPGLERTFEETDRLMQRLAV